MIENADLIASFESAARLYGRAIAASDVKTVNDNASKMSRLFQEISRSTSQRRRFLTLLEHDEAPVRLMASAFGLVIDEARCVAVLESLATEGPYAFEAKQSLTRWRMGDWELHAARSDITDSRGRIASSPENFDAVCFARSLSKGVSLDDIVDVHELDMRIGCVNIYFTNIIGVNDKSIEFYPNSDPPTKEELLAWAWIIRPDMTGAILRQLGDHDLAEGIRRLNQC
jgi:hypothetical protein